MTNSYVKNKSYKFIENEYGIFVIHKLKTNLNFIGDD
ncbi:hypothetical protein ACUXG3_004505 [Bacillus thuringiensis]